MTSDEQLKEQKPQKRRRQKRDQPDPAWTYIPPVLSERAEQFLAHTVQQHPPTVEQGLTVFLHVPVLRQILFWLEQPHGGPTDEQRKRVVDAEAVTHIAGHVDLLIFGAGKRAERERVFIELVEGIALLAFVPGGIPRMPQLCEAHDAQSLATTYAEFKEAEHSEVGAKPGEEVPVGKGLEKEDKRDHDFTSPEQGAKTLYLCEEQGVLVLQQGAYQGDKGRVQAIDYTISPIVFYVRLFKAKCCLPFFREDLAPISEEALKEDVGDHS